MNCSKQSAAQSINLFRCAFKEIDVFHRIIKKIETKISLKKLTTNILVVPIKEVQIVYRLFLLNYYLLHVPKLPSFPAS